MDTLSWLQIGYLFGAGILCGCINALVGGATLLGFPVLLSVGLPPAVANATNFLATVPGYAAAIPFYLKELRQLGRRSLGLMAYGLAGGGIGSLILLFSPSQWFVILTPYLLLVATLLYVFGGQLHGWLSKLYTGELSNSPLAKLLVFGCSVYGGYFGAGLGIIILALLRVVGYRDIHQSNGLKNLLVTAVSLLSIGLFILGGLVSWPEALIMMAGSALGGVLAARYSRSLPDQGLRWVIVAVGFGAAGYYFLEQLV